MVENLVARSQRKAKQREKIPLPLIAMVLVLLVGVVFAMVLGRDFVFAHADQYSHIAKIAFVVLLPAIAVARLVGNSGKASGIRRSAGGALDVVNWMIVVAILAALIVYSPLGYIALANQALGDSVTIPVKVCCVQELKKRRSYSCDRSATIIIGAQENKVCLANHYEPNTDISGRDVLLEVRQSSFGLSMGQLTVVH